MNFDGIYNYYENMVYDEIKRLFNSPDNTYSMDDAEDIACIALNKLPARYIRHSVDAAFFLAEGERESMLKAVSEAVKAAVERVQSHPGVPD